MLQDIQRKIDQVIKVQGKALALLIEILVKDLVFQSGGAAHQVQQAVHVGINQGFYIPSAALAPADMIHRLLNGDVPSGNAQILKYRGKDCLFVLLIHH